MHGHDRHNTTILSVIRNMSTTCFGQYYFWPSSGWIQLSEKTTQYIIWYSITIYNQPNLKVGNASSTQGILHVVVTWIFSFYQLDNNKDICGLESLVLLTQSLKSYTLPFAINLLVYSTVTDCTNQCTSLLSHFFPFNLLTQAAAKKSLTQPVQASRPLLLSSITAGWLLYAERHMECTVPREAKRQYHWNPS